MPAGFAVQTPPRIALDLPGVDATRSASRPSTINQGDLRSVNVVQAGERTRLVLNLKQPASYHAADRGQGAGRRRSTHGAARPPRPARRRDADALRREPRTASTQPLRDIDFRRGADGEGRVVVDLPNNQVGVDIRQQGQSLVVDFLKSTLPRQPAPPPRRDRLRHAGADRRRRSSRATACAWSIEPRGAWEHSAYQSDNQFVVEVRPQQGRPEQARRRAPGYTGEKLSLNFQNVEVRALLQVIADFTNFNIVTSDTVTGNLTLRLKDVPWDQALDIILQAKGLDMRKNGNVIWIAPQATSSPPRRSSSSRRKQQIADLEPVRTQSFQLNYTKAEDIAKGLTGQSTAGGGAAPRRASCRRAAAWSSRPRTNQLFVTDIPSQARGDRRPDRQDRHRRCARC